MALPVYSIDEIAAAIQRADYAFILENAMPYALAENPDAQCVIALVYEAGWGVQRDFLEAERWLLKAAAQDCALAWNNLGTFYAVQHPGFEDRWADAQKCYEKAKELGFKCADPYPPLSTPD